MMIGHIVKVCRSKKDVVSGKASAVLDSVVKESRVPGRPMVVPMGCSSCTHPTLCICGYHGCVG